METFERNKDEQSLQEFVRPFAERFQVSLIAMRIRLEKLGRMTWDWTRRLAESPALSPNGPR